MKIKEDKTHNQILLGLKLYNLGGITKKEHYLIIYKKSVTKIVI